MKTNLQSILFLLIALTTIKLLAQNNNFGVYYNYEDYKTGKLSFIVNCSSHSNKIRLHHFFSGNYIDVIKDEKKYKFSKDSVFGYRDCKQNDYRFYEERDKEYKILENKTIIIYVADVAVTSANGKAREFVKKYFFSTSLTSQILPLTAINLKKSFPDNLKFHNMLDIEFYSANDILSYDIIHKMYKVNFLLSQSTINKI